MKSGVGSRESGVGSRESGVSGHKKTDGTEVTSVWKVFGWLLVTSYGGRAGRWHRGRAGREK
ncbi:MAG: hypothetical protein QNL39_14330, partial [Akkermansiaceae bacterium]